MLKKLTTFYHAFWGSISSLTYYHDVVKAPFTFSLKYFWFFSLSFGFILTAILSTVIIPPVNAFVTRFEKRALNLYPADLVLTIKDGQLSTNVAEPLRFPLPVELFMETPGAVTDQEQQYLLTIDTKATIDDYAKSQSIVFINRDHIVIPNSDSYRLYPIADINDMVITKAAADAFLQKLFPLLHILPFLIVAGLFMVLSIILPISRLLSLLVLSVILLVFARLLKLPLSYTKIYQIGLHGLTLPTLIQVIMISLHLESPIPFFNSILFILYTLVILAELRKPTPLPQIQANK